MQLIGFGMQIRKTCKNVHQVMGDMGPCVDVQLGSNKVANMRVHQRTEWDGTVVVENPHQQKRASTDFIIAHERKVMYH
jgi:hypothetical protein